MDQQAAPAPQLRQEVERQPNFTVQDVQDLQDEFYAKRHLINPASNGEHTQALTLHLLSNLSAVVSAYGEKVRFVQPQTEGQLRTTTSAGYPLGCLPANKSSPSTSHSSPIGSPSKGQPSANRAGGFGYLNPHHHSSGSEIFDVHSEGDETLAACNDDGNDVPGPVLLSHHSPDINSAHTTPSSGGAPQQSPGGGTAPIHDNSVAHFTRFEKKRLSKYLADIVLDACSLCRACEINLSDEENPMHSLSLVATPSDTQRSNQSQWRGIPDHLEMSDFHPRVNVHRSEGNVTKGAAHVQPLPSAMSNVTSLHESSVGYAGGGGMQSTHARTQSGGTGFDSGSDVLGAGVDTTIPAPQPSITIDRSGSPTMILLDGTIRSVVSEGADSGSPKLGLGSRDNSMHAKLVTSFHGLGSSSDDMISGSPNAYQAAAHQAVENFAAGHLLALGAPSPPLLNNERRTSELVTYARPNNETEEGGQDMGYVIQTMSSSTDALLSSPKPSPSNQERQENAHTDQTAAANQPQEHSVTRMQENSFTRGMVPGVPRVPTPSGSAASSHASSTQVGLYLQAQRRKLEELVDTVTYLEANDLTPSDVAQLGLMFVVPNMHPPIAPPPAAASTTSPPTTPDSAPLHDREHALFEELKPGGSAIPLTLENWAEFKELVLQFAESVTFRA